MRLYGEARRLSRGGLVRSEIRRILGLTEFQASTWLSKGIPPHYDRYYPDLRPSPDLAYLLGFWLGDGRDSGSEKKVRFKLADSGQVRLINRITARVLDRKPKRIRIEEGFYVVDYDTVLLHDYLSQSISTHLDCIEKYRADFLRGFFDAEGYVSCSVDVSGRLVNGPVVGVANTRLEYLLLLQRILGEFGLSTSMHTTNRKGGMMTIRGKTWTRRHDVSHLTVTGHERIKRFLLLIGFRNPTKQQKLKDIVNVFSLSPKLRFEWFISRYAKRGRRWLRIAS